MRSQWIRQGRLKGEPIALFGAIREFRCGYRDAVCDNRAGWEKGNNLASASLEESR